MNDFNMEKIAEHLGINKEEAQAVIHQLMHNSGLPKEVVDQIIKNWELLKNE